MTFRPASDDPSEGRLEPIGSSEGRLHAEEIRRLTAKRLNGAAAAVLILEAVVVLFVPRAIAQSGPGLTPWRLTAVLAVVVLLIVAAGLQRRSWGTRAGLAVQVPVLATGFLTGVMWFLGGLFVLVWIYLLRIRSEQLGSLPASPPTEDG
ncbi:MAG: DUF4233 domain-containing protein [Actinomycetota bacterium]|nr:DUF4233 domain-containing protein [Actinomycetota bacterium]